MKVLNPTGRRRNPRSGHAVADTLATRLTDPAETRQANANRQAFGAIVRGIDLFTDPVDRFRHEVRLMYLVFVPECDRPTWTLPETWRVTAEFIKEVDDQARHIDRDRILRTIIDVLTGRAAQINSRKVRPHRTGTGGNNPHAVRADGAKAWRANVQTNTPAARRITWWNHNDGTIELAHITDHDDSRI